MWYIASTNESQSRKGSWESPAERAARYAADPLNLTWVMPA